MGILRCLVRWLVVMVGMTAESCRVQEVADCHLIILGQSIRGFAELRHDGEW